MAGIKALRVIKMGPESTAGTAVAATTIYRAGGTIEDKREVRWAAEDVGYMSGVDRTYTPKLLAGLSMDAHEVTYEQAPYIFASGVENVTSGSSDGVGSGKVYTYNFPTTAKNTIKTRTIEGGDDQQAEEMEYSFVESFGIGGKPGEGLMFESAEWTGRQVTATTFTGAIALPTVEDIPFSLGKLYLDAIGGTIGTTQLTNTWMGLSLKVKTGWVPVFTADGNKYFTFAKSTKPEITFDVTFEHDSTGVARVTDWRAETPRLIRMQWQGSALTTPGTNYSYKTFRFDCAAKIEKVSKIGEQDGNDILTATFRSTYNATAALFAKFVVVNENASLT